MQDENNSSTPRDSKKKKEYVKPEVKRMNGERPAVVSGAPAVPGATAAASVSPVVPTVTVF